MPANHERDATKAKPAKAGRILNPVELQNQNHHHHLGENAEWCTALLEQTPVIPCVRAPEFIDHSARAPGKIVYFLFGNPEYISEMVGRVAAAGKVAVVNIDLAAGFERGRCGLQPKAERSPCRGRCRVCTDSRQRSSSANRGACRLWRDASRGA
jgi:Glycerol-3-phosphate responsive antiterminator